jgi:hypothetical protein
MGRACSTHGETNACRDLVGEPEGKRAVGRHGRVKTEGKPFL